MVFLNEPRNDPREALGHVLRKRAEIHTEFQSSDPSHRDLIKLEWLCVAREGEPQDERQAHRHRHISDDASSA